MAEMNGEDPIESDIIEDNVETIEEDEVDENIEDEEDGESFSDPDDYVDNVSDEELLGDLLKQQPKETDGVENVVIVDGVPQVGEDRLDKLHNVIRKIFSKFGKIVTEYFPKENGKTKGYIFLEYASPANALEAVKTTNGYKLDKQHTFTVNLFTDFEKYMNIPDEWEPPEPQPYKDHGNLQYWLLDSDCYDQFSIISEGGEKTSIWLNSNPEPKLLEERTRWTETYVRWSPLGTYLCTFHPRGIALWGGERFRQIMKFAHSGVQYIDFSPRETYFLTFSPLSDNKDDPQSVIIWDIRTGAKKRGFHCDAPPVWPIFKWSHDDKYFARLTQDGSLSIYETPSFGLLDKKSLKLPGVRDFTWSPTDNIIAYWVAEAKNVPARVILIEIPSRYELRTKNLFNVADCKMHWQKTGDYLAVKVDRYARVKKEKTELKYSGLYYNFEIFHMREKQVPVDIVEIKEPIVAFAWEPVGACCCIIHGESPNISVSFYGVKPGGTVSLLKKFEKKQCNHAFWAPNGQFIVLAGLRSMNGTLEFIDTSNWTMLGQGEHFTATDVEWDPTGRYVVTAVSYWAQKMDNAYWLWSFQGKRLKTFSVDRFCQLLWRPRPQTLLSKDHIQDIKKNLKKYSVQFEAKDRQSITKASKELLEKRKKLLAQFEEYRLGKEEEFSEMKQRRLELRNYIDTDELNSHVENMEDEVVEFFIGEEITVVEE